MPQKHKAPTVSQEQQVPKKMAVNTMACHSDGPVETCSCTTDVQDLLLTYSDASTLSRGDLLSLSLAVSLANLETTSGTAAIIDLLTIIQDPDFDAQRFNIQVKSIACCRKISDRIVKKHKH